MNLQRTVDRFLAHVALCIRCKNQPFDLCKEGEFLLEGIGLDMPSLPRIQIEVKYQPDEQAKREGKNAETVTSAQRLPTRFH